MNGREVMLKRHSVRRYVCREIGEDLRVALHGTVDACNAESGLHMRLCFGEPNAFGSLMGHYGSFRNVCNYIVIAGRGGRGFSETCGYYGEKVVLSAQELGLNTCWVALTYSRGRMPVKLDKGERLCCVIALGYGETQGTPHMSKPLETLCRVTGDAPVWFWQGMEAAMLAPTAMNQQKFVISWDGEQLGARALPGFYTKLDLGIVKYHFELGSGHVWK